MHHGLPRAALVAVVVLSAVALCVPDARASASPVTGTNGAPVPAVLPGLPARAAGSPARVAGASYGRPSRVDPATLGRTGTRTRPLPAPPLRSDAFRAGPVLASAVGQYAAVPTPGSATSTNWSGYVAGGGPFAGASGTFTVPELAAASSETVTSEWVGIDGVTQSALIQAGVQEDYSPSTGLVDTSAWWEILPAPETPITTMQVSPGDSVTVSIAQVSGTVWSIAVTDGTTGRTFATRQVYTGTGSSAEWIVEAPTSLSGIQETLGAYSPPVSFTNLGASGPQTTLVAVSMVQGGSTVSTPSAMTAAGFSVSYDGAASTPPSPAPSATPAASPTPGPASSPAPGMTPGSGAPTIFTVTAGQPVTLGLSGAPDTAFALQASPDDVTWTALAQLATDASGNATYTFTPPATAYYRALFPDGPTQAGLGVVLPPETGTLAVAGPRVITWGSTARFAISFVPNAGRTVEILASRDQVTWSAVATVTTDATGVAGFSYRPATNLYYRAVFQGATGLPAASSGVVRTVVRQIALPTRPGTYTVSRGSTVTLSTVTRPDRPDLPRTSVTFRIYRWSGSRWMLYRSVAAQVGVDGTASMRVTFGAAGSWYVTSLADPTPANANSVWTSPVRYVVR